VTQPRRYRTHLVLGWLLPLVVLLVVFSFPAEAQVYVANSSTGTVSVISTPSNTVVATIPVMNLPRRVTITPNGLFVYVINHNSGTMSKIDTVSNTVVATINVGSLPEGVAVSPDGNSVFVVVGNSLNRFSVATNAQTGTFSLPAGTPVDAAITPDGQLAYVVDRNQNICSLYPVNLATNTILNNSIQCPGSTGAVGGSFPRGVAVRPDGQFVYVTAFQDGALQVVRVSDNLHVGGGCVSAFGCPFGGPIGVAISPDNKFAFTANSSKENTVSIFALDATTGLPAIPIRVSLPGSPSYLGVTPDSRLLYVTHGTNSVSVIDLKASPPLVVQAITVGTGPQGIAVSPLASSGTPPPPPASLSASLAATPETVMVGQSITVTMTVSNTGGSAATGVSASPLTKTGIGDAALTSGPSPGPTTIGPGSSQAFTYTYSASAAGTVTFMGSASGGGVSSNSATSNAVTIQPPPSPPTLSVVPGSLSLTGEVGLADPVSQLVQIGNSGGGTLAWSVTPSIIGDGNWLSASPAGGSAPPPASVLVAASTCGLPSAVYNGSVLVSATGANGSPKSIPVTLTVTQPVTPLPSPGARVCTDRPAYRTGDILRLSVSLRQGSASNTGDAYLFVLVPGTTAFVSLVLSGGLIVPQLGPALVPLGRNFQVPDFAGKILERGFDGSEPPGTYVVKAILAVPGTDPTVAANQIPVAMGSFTFVP